MAEQWYYEDNGNQNGPIDANEFKKLALAGSLNQAKVWKEGMKDWVAAHTIKDLFPKELLETIKQHEEDRPYGYLAPAIFMLVVSGLAMAMTLLGVIAFFASKGGVFSVLCLGLSIIHNCVVIMGSMQIIWLGNYRLAITAAGLVMASWFWLLFIIPSSVALLGLICGIPVGIWSSMILIKPKVNAAFKTDKNYWFW